MSFVFAGPEAMLAKAADLAEVASTIREANTVADAPTAGLQAVAADQVSAAVAALLGSYAQEYQTVGAQMATLHDQLVQNLTASGNAYANTEAANAQQSLLATINLPTQTLLGAPSIGR